MSGISEANGIESLGQPTNGAQAEVRAAVAIATPTAAPPAIEVAPPYAAPAAPPAPPWDAQLVPVQTHVAPPARRRPRWIVPAAIAIVGLIASGTLGGFLYQTIGQRDTARQQLAATQATLTDTQKQLAARKATDAYVDMYVKNSGLVTTEYQNVVLCDSYVSCRTAAQDALNDMKAFQAARAGVAVPSSLANADSQIGDALSAAIAADQELITGMDTNDMTRVKDGFDKFDAAMLSFAKAETALSASIS